MGGLGPWRLERRLGEGGMGHVFAARHARWGRVAAIKALLREAYPEASGTIEEDVDEALHQFLEHGAVSID